MNSDSFDYEDILKRIKGVFKSSTPQEKEIFLAILSELSDKGYSETLETIWLQDFTEVPVPISTFISDSRYMGETNNNGEMVYPFWKKSLDEIFTSDNQYTEILFSGATRIGKTSTAITGMCYMLYRLMIYRDPHTFFRKKRVSKFTVAFANLTKELATSVGFKEFQDTLHECEWFLENGTFTRSERNYIYIPNGNKIEIIPASNSSHLLGKQLWCLVGNTKIVTSEGIKELQEVAGTVQNILQYDYESSKCVWCEAPIVLTKYVVDTVRVELENGIVVEGTPEHRVMLSNGEYKMLVNMSVGDCVCCGRFSKYIKVKDKKRIQHKDAIPVYDVINAGTFRNFCIVDGIGNFCISHNCALMDEVNFTTAGVKDINKAKVAMKSLYDTANARVAGTFRLHGQVYGKLFTCSSKNSDSDYLSEHIETQLNAGNTSMYLVDEPQWKVQPPEMFSKERFKIAVGDRYKRGFVVSEENDDIAHLQEYKESGYTILEVPMDFKAQFNADFDIALRDIAGISVVGAMGFITQESVTVNISEERKNPFYVDIIVCGVSDNETIERYFHTDEVPKDLRRQPIHIHIDFAEVSDHIGICGVCQDGNKVIYDVVTERKILMPFYRQLFQIAIEAPRGDRMSFQKVLNFVIWLRRQGFNVVKVTTDQFQSSYAREVLQQQGFDVDKISVDSSDEPYTGLRNVLQDQRIELVKHQLQEDELVNLRRINNRIDHPPQSNTDSGRGDNYSRTGEPGNGYGKGIGKDCADALCGAVWSLIEDQPQVQPSTKSMASMMRNLNDPMYGVSRPSIFNTFGM